MTFTGLRRRTSEIQLILNVGYCLYLSFCGQEDIRRFMAAGKIIRDK